MIAAEDRRGAVEAIARLIHTYCWRLDGADFEGMASLFDRATWQIDPQTVCHGRDEVLSWLRDKLIVHGATLGTRHIISNLIIDVGDDGETAVSRSYVHVTQVTDDFPLQLISQACYHDRFAKTDGSWHFVERVVHSDGTGDMSHHRRDWQPSNNPNP